MFERLLAVRYIKSQKRHSLFTLSSIAIVMALMTLLFVGYSTYMGILRDAAYADKPYHFKMLRLTEDEYNQLAADPDFISCKRVIEPNYTISAEIMLKTYHDDFGLYINTLFPEKYIYSDRFERFKEDLIDINYELLRLDRLDLSSRYEAVVNLAAYFVFVIFLIMALRLMIDTAFEISSKERERQFGVLQCVGATPAQIVRIITFEGLILCIIGIPIGILLGLGLSVAAFEAIQTSGIAEAFFTSEKITQLMHLHIDPLLLVLATITALVWVFLSAYGTGMRIIKMTPIQAISGRSTKIRKIRRHSLFGLLFGWKGKLAARNNRRQPKRFIITIVSLTLSIALFASFSIVLKQTMASFEKVTELYGLDYDLGLSIKQNQKDPLSYQKGLNIIRDSGYFEIQGFSKSHISFVDNGDGTESLCMISYYPRETFNAQFEGDPPVSYDELTEQNAYLLMVPENMSENTPALKNMNLTQLDVSVRSRTLVTDEEYEKMTPEEQAEVNEYVFDDYQTGEHTVLYRYLLQRYPATLTLAGPATERRLMEYSPASEYLILTGTLDTYESGAYALAGYESMIGDECDCYVNLIDENDYEKAKTYIGMNAGILTLNEDFYGDLHKMRTVIGAVKIGIAFLSVLIGLIAIVNMVNILSTGILNRKSELAAMQCIGMTQGQLNGMTVIECLQYALTAGVLATLLLEGLMYGMLLYLRAVELEDVFGEMLHFADPLPRIWMAAIAAFAAAVIASFIPLHKMQQESLTDQIRSVE